MSDLKYLVIHRKDKNNVGDMAANPLQYFLKKGEYKSVDIADWPLEEQISPDVKIIVGGGGLLSNDNFDNFLSIIGGGDRAHLLDFRKKSWVLNDARNIDTHKNFTERFSSLINETLETLNSDESKKIVWGAGHNADPMKKGHRVEYPNYLDNFNLIGIRDFGQNYSWAPCASCMHPALRKTYEIKNEIIWFDHKKQLTKDFGDMPMPRFINSGNNIEQTIEILGSANIIVTNSFHGVYWGTLLGKRVILTDVWSTKFQTFKHKPYVLLKNEKISDAIDKTTIHAHALDECINATEEFWKQVQQL